MSRDVTDLDTSFILDVIRSELTEYQSLYPSLPTLELRGVWINGSYGAGEATEDSDIDITVEVGVSESEYDMKPLYVSDKITGLGGRMSTSLSRGLPAVPDVAVIPSDDVLSEAEIDAPTAQEHVTKTQNHGGYTRAFDVQANKDVRIS